MVRLGLIGLGDVSGAHLAGIARVDGVQVTAVCDSDPEKLAAGPEGAERYADWRALIAGGAVDAVLLLLPHDLHYPVAAAALDAGLHVCIEKPMALDRGECDDLLARAKRTGKTLSVAENARFVDAYVAAAAILPELGRIRLVRTFIHGSAVNNYRRPDAGWRIRPGGVGAVIDAAPHSFYLLRWLLGDVRTVQASARSWVRDNAVPEVQVEDSAVISGQLEAGGYYTCEVSLSAELPWGERLELHGEHGSLIVDQLAPQPVRIHRGGDDIEGTALDVAYDPHGWQPRSIEATAADFVEAIRDGREPAVTAADAAYAVELVSCAYESIADGGAVVTPNAVA